MFRHIPLLIEDRRVCLCCQREEIKWSGFFYDDKWRIAYDKRYKPTEVDIAKRIIESYE